MVQEYTDEFHAISRKERAGGLRLAFSVGSTSDGVTLKSIQRTDDDAGSHHSAGSAGGRHDAVPRYSC